MHLIYTQDGLWKFVASDVSSGLFQKVCIACANPLAELHDGDYLVPPAQRRPTSNYTVGHGRMPEQSLLNLFGKDFLAAGVDRGRVAPEQLNSTVLPQTPAVPGN